MDEMNNFGYRNRIAKEVFSFDKVQRGIVLSDILYSSTKQQKFSLPVNSFFFFIMYFTRSGQSRWQPRLARCASPTRCAIVIAPVLHVYVFLMS
jgi:hypothetical protein